MQKQVTNNKSSNSNLPIAIIGLVLVAALVGGWWFYSSSKGDPITNTNRPAANKTNPADEAIKTASAGAQPPNMLGPQTAAVTIEEFADYQCPTCATVHTKMKEINALYNGRVKFIYRSFPLTQIHKNAYDAAVAAEAAGMQQKYWAMQDQLFSNQQAWSNSNEARKMFEEYAQKIGLDIAKFQTDMAGLPAKTRVDADLARGRSAQVGGTPTIYINNKPLAPAQMEVSQMRQIIDAELQKGGNQPAAPAPAANSAATNTNAANAAK